MVEVTQSRRLPGLSTAMSVAERGPQRLQLTPPDLVGFAEVKGAGPVLPVQEGFRGRSASCAPLRWS